MKGLPDALFIIDVGYEDIAVSEAVKLGIPVIGVVDSNNSPQGVDYVIPGNDDAIRSICLYAKGIADAIIEGRASVTHYEGEGDADEFVELDESGAPIDEGKKSRPAAKKKKTKTMKKTAGRKAAVKKTSKKTSVDDVEASAAETPADGSAEAVENAAAGEATKPTAAKKKSAGKKTVKKKAATPAGAGDGKAEEEEKQDQQTDDKVDEKA